MARKKSTKCGKKSIPTPPSRRNTRSSNAMPKPPPLTQAELQEVEAPLDDVQEQEIRPPPPTMDIFKPYLDDFVLVFFDNILVYSKNKTDHEDHLRKVLDILREHKLYAKLSKCTFFSPKIVYLGFILSENGISIDPAKVQDIVDWPVPTNSNELRRFLGIIGWYRTFIKGYVTIAAPLTNLLKKGVKINWKPEHQETFDDLKQYVTTAPFLKLPDFDQPFEVVTDASGIAIGGVLMQEGRLVAFTSQKLRIHEKNYPTHDLELLAIVHALKLWRHYLLGR
ncbi:hypothetical protein L7F22_001168 [Adiantum nelumboides]|nr:hypothetical protein [Adiantum nelumboides]